MPGHGDCSPRTRGWTQRVGAALTPGGLLPAYAGMDPCSPSGAWYRNPAPRARGDGSPKRWGGSQKAIPYPYRDDFSNYPLGMKKIFVPVYNSICAVAFLSRGNFCMRAKLASTGYEP